MLKLKIEIKNCWTEKILFEYEKEDNTIRDTLIEAVKSGANLRYADLRDANLRDADLRDANLRDANLRDANLRDADLRGANLRDANLRDANLRDADVRDANLRDANLRDADLRGANLRGANLRDANLRDVKNDMLAVLLTAIPEVANLKKAIIEGKIDGSTYDGDCACLAGTLEKCEIPEIRQRVHRGRNSNRPIERFFLAIRPGDTPENNPCSKLALEWIEEFESYISILV